MGLSDLLVRRKYRWKDIPLITYQLPGMDSIKLMERKLLAEPYVDGKGYQVEAENIAIIREGGIGDLIMLSSAIQAIKSEKPSLKITLVTNYMGFHVLGGAPFIDEMILYQNYDPLDYHVVVNLLMAVEPEEMGGFLRLKSYVSQNRIDIFHRLLCVEDAERKPWLSLDRTKAEMWERTIPRSKPLIGIHAGCSAKVRTIPPEILFDLIKMLTKDFTVVLIGQTESWYADGEMKLKELGGPGIINFIDKTDISEMIALVSIMDFVIAPDSGLLHIAGALGVKTVGIFGNIFPMTRCKYYPTIKAMFPDGALDCVPCHDLWHCDMKGKVGAPCMRVFSAKDIYETSMKWMDGE